MSAAVLAVPVDQAVIRHLGLPLSPRESVARFPDGARRRSRLADAPRPASAAGARPRPCRPAGGTASTAGADWRFEVPALIGQDQLKRPAPPCNWPRRSRSRRPWCCGVGSTCCSRATIIRRRWPVRPLVRLRAQAFSRRGRPVGRDRVRELFAAPFDVASARLAGVS